MFNVCAIAYFAQMCVTKCNTQFRLFPSRFRNTMVVYSPVEGARVASLRRRQYVTYTLAPQRTLRGQPERRSSNAERRMVNGEPRTRNRNKTESSRAGPNPARLSCSGNGNGSAPASWIVVCLVPCRALRTCLMHPTKQPNGARVTFIIRSLFFALVLFILLLLLLILILLRE